MQQKHNRRALKHVQSDVTKLN